ncbi:hypothetical protein AYI68_g4696 [Smittium mucronatum]|uniref:Uncharacterized protein n=1 Tax=Smittium mucronatum TaxID=133383 RepID=A0A1R0GWE5_9FUNG|nr:hypothetical protein AYI68_g4696 [Smittium mucronatum]
MASCPSPAIFMIAWRARLPIPYTEVITSPDCSNNDCLAPSATTKAPIHTCFQNSFISGEYRSIKSLTSLHTVLRQFNVAVEILQINNPNKIDWE